MQHAAPLQAGASNGVVAQGESASPAASSLHVPLQANNREASPRATTDHGPRATEHAHTLVLPSVPVDQLLDDHAVEFEECKRWANSEAGQAARMTNPAGFADVRAHAEAHLRALQRRLDATPNSA